MYCHADNFSQKFKHPAQDCNELWAYYVNIHYINFLVINVAAFNQANTVIAFVLLNLQLIPRPPSVGRTLCMY